jgi:hypothetical protein
MFGFTYCSRRLRDLQYQCEYCKLSVAMVGIRSTQYTENANAMHGGNECRLTARGPGIGIGIATSANEVGPGSGWQIVVTLKRKRAVRS